MLSQIQTIIGEVPGYCIPLLVVICGCIVYMFIDLLFQIFFSFFKRI